MDILKKRDAIFIPLNILDAMQNIRFQTEGWTLNYPTKLSKASQNSSNNDNSVTSNLGYSRHCQIDFANFTGEEADSICDEVLAVHFPHGLFLGMQRHIKTFTFEPGHLDRKRISIKEKMYTILRSRSRSLLDIFLCRSSTSCGCLVTHVNNRHPIKNAFGRRWPIEMLVFSQRMYCVTLGRDVKFIQGREIHTGTSRSSKIGNEFSHRYSCCICVPADLSSNGYRSPGWYPPVKFELEVYHERFWKANFTTRKPAITTYNIAYQNVLQGTKLLLE